MAANFSVGQNFPMGQQWKHYYPLRPGAGRPARGHPLLRPHDWYRLGAEELVQTQNRLSGFWRGVSESPVVATSFALLFLAKGRAPVLVNKLRHGPRNDWNNDPDDVRNIVSVVSRDWKSLLTWQVVDPAVASVADLLQAPIVFFNGHQAPEFNAMAQQNLREFVEQGGFLFADACCSSPEFDAGFKELMKKIFPEQEFKLQAPLRGAPGLAGQAPPDPRAPTRSGASSTAAAPSSSTPPRTSPATGTRPNARPTNTAVILATKVGQNVIDYATGKELPADKLRRPRGARLQGRPGQAGRLADRQAAARRRLERGPPGGAQPDGRPAQAPPVASTWWSTTRSSSPATRT